MLQEMTEVGGITPSLPTWSALLNAYADSGEPQQAAGVLHRMQTLGIVPTVQVNGWRVECGWRQGGSMITNPL